MRKIQIIYGLHSVKAALLNNKRVHSELILNENSKFPIDYFKTKIRKISILDNNKFKKSYGNEQSTQGIVLKTEDFKRPSLEEFIKNQNKKVKSVIIVLDQITDPQNIGSIMRSCALFNCGAIVSSKDNSPELTPSLLKAASGAAELVNFYKVTNLRRSISNFKSNGYWIYCFDSSDNNNSSDISFEKKSVLVFGSEGKGVRNLIKKECDIFIKLKMEDISKFNIDSLNVSNATSIALYEFYKKQ
ncbi:23S rRNA (guanosine(2251)-2'-O)-methyltransferase RlmB [Pelagibacteraceae bacterium]|nr:23S rRNA (guanosine(2251)-2'-O)-methyltransferase RlmB [Pelagibacteraceae bacterium]